MKAWYFLVGLSGLLVIMTVGGLVISSTTKRLTSTTNTTVTVARHNVQATINPAPEVAGPITLTFVGDIMLDRYVRTTINRHSPVWPFEQIKSELLGNLVIGNLEGPFTTHASVATDTNLVFTFDPASALGLVDAGFTHFSLANNHTLNFGQAGLDNTRTVLADQALQSFGDPKNRAGFSTTLEAQGRTIAFIGYHGLVSGRDTIMAEIQKAKTAGALVIVMAHWGNEYQSTPSKKQIADAHALVEAGADLIIGAHPHVIQPIEVYQGKMIFYSLGNFLFDQYFSEATQRGLLVRFTLDDGVISAALVPVAISAGQIQLPVLAERDRILTTIAKDSNVAADLQKNITDGRFTLPLLQ